MNINMRSDSYERIWFKVGTMRETTKYFKLMLVCVTSNLIQGHRVSRKYNNNNNNSNNNSNNNNEK